MVKKANLLKFLVSVMLCQFAGAIGAIFTASSVKNWFPLLEKPFSALRHGSFLLSGFFSIRLWEFPFILSGRKGYKNRRSKWGCLFSAFS
jgi:tryptophan-rich sensory protein